MNRSIALLLLLVSSWANAANLNYYFPKNTTFDPDIPPPESVLGYSVGDWHVRHDQLVLYMRTIAAASPRVSLEEIGQTHEQRPLLILSFSTPDNISKLADIQKAHIKGVEDGHNDEQPAILWMGYSVHGNESSGANAAILLAYYLAAAQGEQIDKILANSVILMEPTINPDGLSRFAQWANMHKGYNLVADKQHREHVEDWPSGRTNHYWFDLNRDWLLLTHPESQARIKYFHTWKPNLVTDFHEMGTNSSYFFQPGIPTRKNPYTPDKNVQLTKVLAKYHAKALDQLGSLYFTEESYDDFYAGKGSTYPDLQGAVGVLFEQASSRGHLQESINGNVTFPFTIKNQLVASLSSLQGAVENKLELLNYQNKFFDSALSEAKKDSLAGYLLSEDDDHQRLSSLLSLLAAHQINSYQLTDDIKIQNKTYNAQTSYFIPIQQPQFRLIKSIFSTQKSFPDNTFYDVSNWNLAYSFNIDFQPIKRSMWGGISHQTTPWQVVKHPNQNTLIPAYAYAFKWQQYNAPKLVSALLQAKVPLRFSSKAFQAKSQGKNVNFNPGSIIIAANNQRPDHLAEILAAHADDHEIKIYPIDSGLTPQGIDVGSRNMVPIEIPKLLLIGGKGISQYEAGELWHYMDTRVGLPLTIIEHQRLSDISLNRYSHIFMVNGSHKLSKTVATKLEGWVKKGGVLISQKSAAKWLADNNILRAEFLTKKDYLAAYDTSGLQFKDREKLAGKKRIAGAVFEYELDSSHPLTFGFEQKTLPGFKNSNQVMLAPDSPFINVASYSKSPLLAGYASKENIEFIKGSAAIVAHKKGQGRVIAFSDNPNFRGVWYGTSHLIANAIFFSKTITASGN